MSGWKSIETAPVDGTNVLLWGTAHSEGPNAFDIGPAPFIGYYDAEDAKWRLYETDYYTVYLRPSHWRPCPEGPA
jgi:hypothetical protein